MTTRPYIKSMYRKNYCDGSNVSTPPKKDHNLEKQTAKKLFNNGNQPSNQQDDLQERLLLEDNNDDMVLVREHSELIT